MKIRSLVGWSVGLGLLASAVLVGINPQPGQAATVSTDQPATDTQVAVITVDPTEGLDELPANLAAALETAETRAADDPSNLAPPYLNRGTGRIVAPVTAAADSTKVAYAASAIPINNGSLADDGIDNDAAAAGANDGKTEEVTTAATTPPTAAAFPTFYYPTTPVVKYSMSELTSVKGDVLASDVTGVASMFEAFIDAEHNRVLVRATSVTDEMRTALSTRYAPDEIALLLSTDEVPQTLSRSNDTSPFWGGAYAITTTGGSTRWHCTIGFPWNYNGDYYYITAGHCTGLNTHVWMPNYGSTKIGLVVKDGWKNGTGSVKIDGQGYNTGDVSLVKLYSPYMAGWSMYVGGPNSTTSRQIGAVWSRAPKPADKVCSGGSTTGQLCGWKVKAVGVDVRYIDGTLLRNAVHARRSGTCAAGGDSGGPVYTVRSNGTIAPRGIISGGTDRGCDLWFSDIRIAEKSLPGAVQHH